MLKTSVMLKVIMKALKKDKEEVYCLLNNDVEVTKGWLDSINRTTLPKIKITITSIRS